MNTGYVRCPACREPMPVQKTDIGVGLVWHGVHCGWGQDSFEDDEVYPDLDTIRTAIRTERENGNVSRSTCELCDVGQATTTRHGLGTCTDCAETIDRGEQLLPTEQEWTADQPVEAAEGGT